MISHLYAAHRTHTLVLQPLGHTLSVVLVEAGQGLELVPHGIVLQADAAVVLVPGLPVLAAPVSESRQGIDHAIGQALLPGRAHSLLQGHQLLVAHIVHIGLQVHGPVHRVIASIWIGCIVMHGSPHILPHPHIVLVIAIVAVPPTTATTPPMPSAPAHHSGQLGLLPCLPCSLLCLHGSLPCLLCILEVKLSLQLLSQPSVHVIRITAGPRLRGLGCRSLQPLVLLLLQLDGQRQICILVHINHLLVYSLLLWCPYLLTSREAGPGATAAFAPCQWYLCAVSRHTRVRSGGRLADCRRRDRWHVCLWGGQCAPLSVVPNCQLRTNLRHWVMLPACPLTLPCFWLSSRPCHVVGKSPCMLSRLPLPAPAWLHHNLPIHLSLIVRCKQIKQLVIILLALCRAV
eukprot:comp13825_c2_seq1/m.9570 comp13825_c2_seq1/g.9570  ORF comp13825_c2_seq1/g.9570 comp13825_c2_seq1/m.9570 type:complete len:402 (+) comp13825_c2_seq1:625-1830(+)